jgi:tetratricopeptide (TPR) repeat protein
MKTLQRGSKHQQVSVLQKFLQKLNLNPGDIDGKFGEKTETAVQQFQRQQNISEYGIVGVETWEKLIEVISFLDRAELKITTPITAEVCFNRGLIFLFRDPYKAVGNFTQAIQLEPNWAKAYYHRGIVYLYDIEDEQQALKDFEQAINCHPPYAAAYFERGLLRYLSEDQQGAINDLSEAIRFQPDNAKAYCRAEVYYRRAVAYEDLGESQKAIKDYMQVFQICRGVCKEEAKEVIQDLQVIELDPDLALAYYRGVARYYISDDRIEREGYTIEGEVDQQLPSELIVTMESSLEDLSEAIRLAPNFADAYYYRGHARNGDEADEDFTQAIRFNPQFASAYYYRGCLRTDENKEGAIEDFNQAIQHNQDFALLAHYRRGLLYSELGEEKKAIDDYREYLRLDPEMTAATRFKIKSLSFNDQISCAKQIVTEDYLQTLEFSRKDAEAYTQRGKLRSWLGDYKGAIEDFTQAIKQNPDYAEAYYYRGLNQHNSGDSIKAIEDFTRAIEKNPVFAEAYFELGCIRYQIAESKIDEEMIASVREDFTQAININRILADAYYFRGSIRKWGITDWVSHNLGEIRERGDDPEIIEAQPFNQEEMEDLKNAIRINPYFDSNSYSKWHDIRNLCPDLGNDQEVIDNLTEAIGSNLENADAYLQRGIALYKSGDWQGAIADFTEVIRINPENAEKADAYYGRGLIYYRLREYARAIEDFTQAMGSNPIFAELYALRGLARYDLGELQGAIEDCNQAIWLDPSNANANFIRTCSQYNLGDESVQVTALWPVPPMFAPEVGGGGVEDTAKITTETERRNNIQKGR